MDALVRPNGAHARFAPAFRPPRPRAWSEPKPAVRTMLQLRRDAIPTWGPIAYRELILAGSFLNRPSVLLNDPAAIRHVLIDHQDRYRRSPAAKRILHPMIGDGLILSEGEQWRRQRRASAPAFAPRSLPIIASTTARLSAALTGRLAAAGRSRVQLLGMVQKLALEVIGDVIFSRSLADRTEELRGHLERYGRLAARPSPFDFLAPQRFTTPDVAWRNRVGAAWHRSLEGLIAERRRRGVSPEGHDLFDLLAGAVDPQTGQGFSELELRDQIATLILAGHETTALTIFWACYLLAQAPQIQERVAQEAAAAGPVLDDPARLPFTRCVIDETLRLYPPVYSMVREAVTEDEVGGHPVAPGTMMVVSPWVLHRHEAHWCEPEIFDPDGFAQGVPPSHRFIYLPFGTGPRVCIGAQFALTEAVIAVASLVRVFEITQPQPRRVLPQAMITLFPDRSPTFRLRLR